LVNQQKAIQTPLPGVRSVSDVPRQARDYLDAVRRYYQPGVTRTPRNADIAAAHVPRLEPRTWDRRKAELRSGKWGDRDWIEVWPPPSDWHPSWEGLLVQSVAVDHIPVEDDGRVHLVIDEAYDANGRLVERRLIRTLGHLSSLAAAYAVSALVDLSDGRLDFAFDAGRFGKAILDLVCRVVS
jgi:hypothetical protein